MAKVFKYGLVFFILVAFITNHQDEMFKAILDSPNQVYLYLSTNFIANLLGVGSLASISGLKAMKSLTKYQTNPKIPCKEMMLLVILNTTGLSIIPTTMMTLRQSYGSKDILGFFGYSIVIGLIITVIGVIASKVIEHYE